MQDSAVVIMRFVPVRQIPESRLDIFEDVEPSPSDDEYAESLGQDTSLVNHDGHASQATSWYEDV